MFVNIESSLTNIQKRYKKFDDWNSSALFIRAISNVECTQHHINSDNNHSNADWYIIDDIGRLLLIHFINIEHKAQYNAYDSLEHLKTIIDSVKLEVKCFFFRRKNDGNHDYLQGNRCDHQR